MFAFCVVWGHGIVDFARTLHIFTRKYIGGAKCALSTPRKLPLQGGPVCAPGINDPAELRLSTFLLLILAGSVCQGL